MRPLVLLLILALSFLIKQVVSEDPVQLYGPKFSLVQLYPRVIWPGAETLLYDADSFTWEHQDENGTAVTIASCLAQGSKACNYTDGWTVEWTFDDDWSCLDLHFVAPWEGGIYTWKLNTGGNITSYSLNLQLVDVLGTIKPQVHTFCPMYWIGYGSKCYYHSTKKPMTFEAAQEVCNKMGGFLAKPKTMDLFLMLANSPRTHWIGATKEDGEWKWLDGSRVALSVPIGSEGTYANMYKFGIDALNDSATDNFYCEQDAKWNERVEPPPAPQCPACEDCSYTNITSAIQVALILQGLLIILWGLTCLDYVTPIFKKCKRRQEDEQPLVVVAPWQSDINLTTWQEP